MMNSFMPTPQGSIPVPPALYQDDPSQLPGWVKSPSSRIDTDDFEYLLNRGALIIPDQALRDECLACFMEWVYPYSPIVDLNDIARAISHQDGSGGHVSLPVFQAIMFAGIGFVDMSSLHMAGFQSRKEAKKAFFRKVKVCMHGITHSSIKMLSMHSCFMTLASTLDRSPLSKLK